MAGGNEVIVHMTQTEMQKLLSDLTLAKSLFQIRAVCVAMGIDANKVELKQLQPKGCVTDES